MYELTVNTHFSAAHRLRGYQGKCENLHGHNWVVTARLGGGKLNDLGMVMDFDEARKLLNQVVEKLDHAYLNEVEPFDSLNPTTENIAGHIAGELAGRFPEGVCVKAVTCWESEGCGASCVLESD